MMSDPVRWLCIAWAPHMRRSETFARELDCKLYLIHNLRFQYPPAAPFKYILQTFRTIRVLLREKPHVVHAANPPLFCGLTVYLFSLFTNTRFVLDHHSAAFSTKWRWALPLQKFLSRKALTNIVTNRHWAGIVDSWGAQSLVMIDPFEELPPGSPYPVNIGLNMVYINTFAKDEPLAQFLRAAEQAPQVHFYVTSGKKYVSKKIIQESPPNVTYTGFLPDEEYIGLLRAATAVISLTTRDNTFQQGGCEAISMGKPLITSDWPFLREVFGEGAVFVPNTSQGIYEGIQKMIASHKTIQKKIGALRLKRRKMWDRNMATLKNSVIQSDV